MAQEPKYKVIIADNEGEPPSVTIYDSTNALNSLNSNSHPYKLGYGVCDFMELEFSESSGLKNQSPEGKKPYYLNFCNDYKEVLIAYKFVKDYLTLGFSLKGYFTFEILEIYLDRTKIPRPIRNIDYHLPQKTWDHVPGTKAEKNLLDLAYEIEAVLKKKHGPITTTYDCEKLIEIAFAEIFHVISLGYTFKLCEHCNKVFVPQKTDTKYCDRASLQFPHKTCGEAAKYIKQLERERADEAYKIRKSIYNIKLTKFGSDSVEMSEFLDQDSKWKKGIKTGKNTDQEYMKWLKSHYAGKKRGELDNGQYKED